MPVIFVLCFLVTLFACLLGTICGMGGGIIIKPVLDACGVMSGVAVTFLSGVTVIGMTCWNLGKTLLKKEAVIDAKHTPLLAVSAAAGGLLGKILFNKVAGLFAVRDTASGIQAAVLFLATLATLLYTLKKDSLPSKHVDSPWASLLIGFVLGVFGAFLGIGGGPFNVAVLFFFFSMASKRAAQNSLFIILFSQLASTLKTVFSGNIPTFNPWILAGMIVVGILGNELGRRLNRTLDDKKAIRWMVFGMALIMAINIYNVFKYLL